MPCELKRLKRQGGTRRTNFKFKEGERET